MQTLPSALRELKGWLYEEETFFTRRFVFFLGNRDNEEHLKLLFSDLLKVFLRFFIITG